MSQFCPNVPKVRGFGETFQYAPGEYAPQRVSKVWPKHVTIGTLGQKWDILWERPVSAHPGRRARGCAGERLAGMQTRICELPNREMITSY